MRQESAQPPQTSVRGDWFDRWLWWHFPLRPWERQGRFWESIGLGAYYTLLLRLTGEPDFREVLAGLERGETRFSRADVEWHHQECRYHDAVNTIRVGHMVPIAAALLVIGSPWFWLPATYTLIHFASSAVDRMKQGLLHRYEARAEELGIALPEESTKSAPATAGPTPFHKMPLRLWYDPKPWETEPYFKWAGVLLWQRLVVFLTKKAWYRPGEWPAEARTSFFREGSRQELVNFEHATRFGETIHVIGVVSMLPIAWVFWQANQWAAFWFTVFTFLTDVQFGLLLRYHRSRIWKLYQRIMRRASA